MERVLPSGEGDNLPLLQRVAARVERYVRRVGRWGWEERWGRSIGCVPPRLLAGTGAPAAPNMCT